MRFAFIKAEKANYPVGLMCKLLHVSRAGFYAWTRRQPGPRARENAAVEVHINAIHKKSQGRYGSPRIHKELCKLGFPFGKNRVARLMRQMQVAARLRRRYVVTTKSGHGRPVSPNVLDRKFRPSCPNQVWATDITYIATTEGWLYLAVVVDLYSRRVVGWCMDARMDETLVLRALDMALKTRRPAKGLVHHSDRGSQYAGTKYQEALQQRGLVGSMSRKGNCWDNAVVESFFSSLKAEEVERQRYASRLQAKVGIGDWLSFYNHRRSHSTLGYVSPVDFEWATRRSGLVV